MEDNNKENNESLSKYMEKIVEAMKQSKEKQDTIDYKTNQLREENRFVLVEDGKKEVSRLKQEKEEFDKMTIKALIYARKQVLLNKKNVEKEYQEMAEKVLKSQKEIEAKLRAFLSREITDEKREIVKESAKKSEMKLKEHMDKFQHLLMLKRAKLDEYEKNIEAFALQLGVEDKIKMTYNENAKNKVELTLDEKELLDEEKSKKEQEETKTAEESNEKKSQSNPENIKEEAEKANIDEKSEELNNFKPSVAEELSRQIREAMNITQAHSNNNKTSNKEEVQEKQEEIEFEEIAQKPKLVSININECLGRVIATTEDGEKKVYKLSEIFGNKKQLFKSKYVKEDCIHLCKDKFKGRLLARKVNPAIISVLKDDIDMRNLYLKCLKEKRELPFEIVHDLRNSGLGFFDKWAMRRCAKAENKIPGTKVIFEERLWNKNKTLPKPKMQNTGKDIRKEVRVDNKDGIIEAEAKKSIEEPKVKMEKEEENMSK